jgi:hypothetical protein
MEKDSRETQAVVFDSFEEADAAEKAYYHSLSPAARMEIALELSAAYREGLGEASSRLERVYRVTRRELG